MPKSKNPNKKVREPSSQINLTLPLRIQDTLESMKRSGERSVQDVIRRLLETDTLGWSAEYDKIMEKLFSLECELTSIRIALENKDG